MENELVLENGASKCMARIENGPESVLGCSVTLIRDATGEILYQSKVVDPGYYIETITLDVYLQKGYYPCTIIWSFYEVENDETEERI